MPEEAAAGQTRGELEKLVIDAYITPDYSGSPVARFKAAFNPDEYILVYDIEYEESQGSGTTGSPMVFKRIKPQDFTLKLLLDGTGVSGEAIDVAARVEEFFRVVGYDGDIHRPRYLQVLWGTLRSNCVLLKAEVTYKMFRSDGTPVRAWISASFRAAVDDATRVRNDRASSPDLTHIRTVCDGDKLPVMGFGIYGDISHTIDLARINGLSSIRRLRTGDKVIFPPLEKT